MNGNETCAKVFLSADVDSRDTGRYTRPPIAEWKVAGLIVCAFGRDSCGVNHLEMAGK